MFHFSFLKQKYFNHSTDYSILKYLNFFFIHRRVLKPFLYYTGSVNMVSCINLAPKNALLHRMTCFTYEAIESAFEMNYEDWKYQTLPDLIASKVEIYNYSDI